MSTRTISPLRQRMIDDMTARQVGPRTQKAYIQMSRLLKAAVASSSSRIETWPSFQVVPNEPSSRQMNFGADLTCLRQATWMKSRFAGELILCIDLGHPDRRAAALAPLPNACAEALEPSHAAHGITCVNGPIIADHLNASNRRADFKQHNRVKFRSSRQQLRRLTAEGVRSAQPSAAEKFSADRLRDLRANSVIYRCRPGTGIFI